MLEEEAQDKCACASSDEKRAYICGEGEHKRGAAAQRLVNEAVDASPSLRRRIRGVGAVDERLRVDVLDHQ
jgi:hypothetical protein